MQILSRFQIGMLWLVVMGIGTCWGDSKMDESSERTDTAAAEGKVVLDSALAGSWYTSDAEALRGQLRGYLQKAQSKEHDKVIALILPHAGYRYSGAMAMAGVKTLGQRQYKRIVVMGPSHRLAMNNVLSVPDVTHYRTPLGETALDTEFISELRQHRLFVSIPTVHQQEHSVQIEVPVLQYVQKDFQLVPIVVGRLDEAAIGEAARILRGLIDANTLVVASSDFTHYGDSFGYVPFKEEIAENLKKLDLGAYEFIEGRDRAGFVKYCERTGATICGSMPIAVLLEMLPTDSAPVPAGYDTSGRLLGDFSSSVSYMSVAFTGEWSPAKRVIAEQGEAELSEADKKQLLLLARRSFTHYIEHKEVADAQALGITLTEAMKPPRATFVTLKKHGNLRGCIGELSATGPLYQSVLLNAIKSAVRDTRFAPVTQNECADLQVEISVLTPPEKVASYKDIILGKHGVILSKGVRGAVYLPQVAVEQGWGLEETLTHLSVKAGLGRDGWREGAEFEVFEAIVFGEEESAGSEKGSE